uniref:laccase n=1 Tax=Cyathus bulleri TaxID=184115 RepID=A0A8K1S5L7_9AGAR|nr:laccase 9 [Cyathus bulleri]UES62899.1 laccase 9 [Cyathus bulleri]
MSQVQLMRSLTSAIIVGFLVLGAKAATVRRTLEISNKVVQPDGFKRSATVVSGSHPGPLLTGNIGDRFMINVVNKLNDPNMFRLTTVHWHGMFQRGSFWDDGVAGVTQCPIAPGHSFVYDFTASNQAGTFWYHSHYGTQYCDGLRGPVVIYDPDDPHKNLYDVDDASTVITLGEWYHTSSRSSGTGVGQASSTLINGLGRYIGGPQVDLAVVNVERGKRYRFRLISISCDPNHLFSISGHKLTIIEADGESTQPLTVDKLQIFAGQRYSFVLEANQPVGNYWIRAIPNSGLGGLSSTTLNGVNSAILRYKGARKAEPTTDVVLKSPKLFNETELHALVSPAAPANAEGQADVHINLQIARNGSLWTMNNITYFPPSVPVLLQMLSHAKKPEELLPQGSIIYLPRNKVIELVIPGGGSSPDSPHPFHLHGHSFSVVRSAGSNTTNYKDPVRRDVTQIGFLGSQATVRFTTDNPGPWIFHCHIDWHLAGGLAVVFAEAPEEVSTISTPTVQWEQLCPIESSLTPSII